MYAIRSYYELVLEGLEAIGEAEQVEGTLGIQGGLHLEVPPLLTDTSLMIQMIISYIQVDLAITS